MKWKKKYVKLDWWATHTLNRFNLNQQVPQAALTDNTQISRTHSHKISAKRLKTKPVA